MTAEHVRGYCRGHVIRHGSMRDAARAWKVSAAYLCDVLNGKREPGPKILKRLGMVKVVAVRYEWGKR